MEYTEEVETVLPANYTLGKTTSTSSRRGRKNEGGGSSSSKGMGGRGRKMFSRLRKFARSRSRSSSRERFNGKTSSLDKKLAKSSKKQPTQLSSPSSASTQKMNNTKDAKESRDTEEKAAAVSQPVREGSPTPTTDSYTDGSAEVSQQSPMKVDTVAEEDDEPLVDTASIYGKITGMLSPKKQDTIPEEGEEDAGVASMLQTATSALTRTISAVSVSSKKSTGSSKKAETGDEDTAVLQTATSALSISSKKSTKSEAPVEVHEQEQPDSAGQKWAKNISLKIGGYQTSFQLTDPVTAITGKVNEVKEVIEQGLVNDAKAMDDPEKEERDYEKNPTELFLLLQQKAWGLASQRLDEHPEEAKIWVHRKLSPEKAPNVHDANDPEKSQAIVPQSQALSTVVNQVKKYRWRLLPLHASIVLGAPSDLTIKILNLYPAAAREVDDRESLPVHLAASRLDVDEEGEKIVLRLFGVYADSIDIKDRNGRTAPELAKLARARKAAEKQRLMETASRRSSKSHASYANVETSVSRDGRKQYGDDDDQSVSSVKSSFSTRFKMMMRGSKSMDMGHSLQPDQDELVAAKSAGDDEIVADAEGMVPGFAFLEVAKSTEEREAEAIAEEVSKAISEEETKSVGKEYKTSKENLTSVPSEALDLPLPPSKSFGDSSVKSKKSKEQEAGDSIADDSTATEDASTVVTEAVDSVVASADPRATLRALLEKAVENAGRKGMDVTKFLEVLEEEWVTDVEAIRRLDGDTLDAILPIMLSRELQRLVNHANLVDGEYLRKSRGRTKKRPGTSAKKIKKKRSSRKKPSARYGLTPINETSIVEEEEEEEEESTADVEEEESECTPDKEDGSTPSASDNSGSSSVDEEIMAQKHAALVLEARTRFPTRAALEDAIRERQAIVKAAVSSGFDVDKQTLAKAALADDEVRKLLPLRLVLPSVADLEEMVEVLQSHKEIALKSHDVRKALGIQKEIDEIQRQIEEEGKYLRKKRAGQTSCTKCGDVFDTQKKMVGILKKKEMVCDNCREMPEV